MDNQSTVYSRQSTSRKSGTVGAPALYIAGRRRVTRRMPSGNTINATR
jgi:hypothetical protein